MSYQVPQAAIALKQGAGRLIRDISDRGLLVTFDPRMLRRGYGQKFLDAMPPFARTRDLEAALAFCAALPGGEDRGDAVAGPLAGAQEH
jgi:ATP-dependent DNA helicase DinG